MKKEKATIVSFGRTLKIKGLPDQIRHYTDVPLPYSPYSYDLTIAIAEFFGFPAFSEGFFQIAILFLHHVYDVRKLKAYKGNPKQTFQEAYRRTAEHLGYVWEE